MIREQDKATAKQGFYVYRTAPGGLYFVSRDIRCPYVIYQFYVIRRQRMGHDGGNIKRGTYA